MQGFWASTVQVEPDEMLMVAVSATPYWAYSTWSGGRWAGSDPALGAGDGGGGGGDGDGGGDTKGAAGAGSTLLGTASWARDGSAHTSAAAISTDKTGDRAGTRGSYAPPSGRAM